MVPLTSIAIIAWIAFQWLCSVLVLLVVGALLAETSPSSSFEVCATAADGDGRRVPVGGNATDHSPGERAAELLLAALERLGAPVGWLRAVLMDKGGAAEGRVGRGGVLKRFRARKRNGTSSRRPLEEQKAPISLAGVSLSLTDIRIVDSKFECYRITITRGAGATGATGTRWEVWRRMTDMIKLKAALSKVSAADVDLPPLPHSYRRNFDASRLTRRRRSIQEFLQVALEHPALRDNEALVDFLSPEPQERTSGRDEARPGGSPASGPLTPSASRAGAGAGAGGSGGKTSLPPSQTPPRDRMSVGHVAGAVDGGAVVMAKRSTDSASSPGERGAAREGGGGGGGGSGGSGGRPSVLPAPNYLPKDEGEEDGASSSPSSSDEDDVGVAGGRGEAGVVDAAGWSSVNVELEGGLPVSPRSPLGSSSRNSGRKSMHYMKNAMMTGTRKIARHVPMSMPTSKTIQRHIPMPKGVPKFPTKYNPYKRSSTRRGNSESPDIGSSTGGSTSDTFSGGAYGGYGGGGYGNSGHSELGGLTWQGEDGYDDNGRGSRGSGVGISGGGGSGAGDDGSVSPRRKSYLWKRPTWKAGGVGGAQVGASGMNDLLRARSETSTPAASSVSSVGGAGAGAGGVPDVGVVVKAFSDEPGRSPRSPFFPEEEAEWKGMVAMPGGAPGGGNANMTPAASAAVASPTAAAGRAGGKGNDGSPVRARVLSGDGDCAGRGVRLTAGITDGGEGHKFKVRGASFLSDGLEVQGEPALCPLVYAELFAIADRQQLPRKTAEKTSKRRVADAIAAGRVDHIAVMGRCATRIAELTARPTELAGGQAAKDGVAPGPPFLIIFNFQIPGDPPLSLVAAWAVHPELLGPDSPDSLRTFFGLFYRLVDIPLSPLPTECSSGDASSEGSSGEDENGGRGNSGAAVGDCGCERAIDDASGNGRSGRDTRTTSNSSSSSISRNPRDYTGGSGSGRDGGSAARATDGVPGPDDLRNQRLKLAVRLLHGPRAVTEALPSSGSVMLGQKATLRFFRGERYLEVDADLATSSATSEVTALCRQNARNLVMDVGLILHGDSPGELPEGVLGVIRLEGLDPQDADRHRPLW